MHQSEKRKARIGVTLLGVGLSLVLCNITHADAPRRALVVPVGLSGYVPDRDVWQPAFDERLVKALLKGNYETVKPTHKEVAGCTDDLCLTSLAAKYHADVMLHGEVHGSTTSGAPSYQIVVWLFDPSLSSPRKQLAQTCPACTEVDASEMLYRMALQILGPASEPSVAPSTEPSPLPGPSLLPMPTPTSTPIAETHPLKITGGVLLGVGLAAIIPGAALLAINGNGSCSPSAGQKLCPQEHQTLAGGAALTAVGAVAAITGTVLLIIDAKRKTPRQVAVGADITGQSASLTLSGSY